MHARFTNDHTADLFKSEEKAGCRIQHLSQRSLQIRRCCTGDPFYSSHGFVWIICNALEWFHYPICVLLLVAGGDKVAAVEYSINDGGAEGGTVRQVLECL